MTDIFTAEVTAPAETDFLSELVGEDKKFKTPAELARGKYEADKHIDNLNKTLTELREELKTRTTTDELMDRINQLQTQPREQNREPQAQEENQKVTGLTKEDVDKMFAEREAQSRQSSNLVSAQQTLLEKYGDQAPAQIEQKAQTLGITKDYLRQMAASTPAVFLALFTDPPKPRTGDVFATPSGQGLRAGTSKAVNGLKKYSDFQKLKRENPNQYFSAKVQQEILDLGDRAAKEGVYDQWKQS